MDRVEEVGCGGLAALGDGPYVAVDGARAVVPERGGVEVSQAEVLRRHVEASLKEFIVDVDARDEVDAAGCCDVAGIDLLMEMLVLSIRFGRVSKDAEWWESTDREEVQPAYRLRARVCASDDDYQCANQRCKGT